MTNDLVNCLLVETKDNRKFFMSESYYNQLIEFARTFGAKISVVTARNPSLLCLSMLAAAINDNQTTFDTTYQEDEIKIERKLVARPDKKVSQYVRDRIKNKFIEGGTVSLDELVDNFKEYGLDRKQLSSHIQFVRTSMTKLGRKFIRSKAGIYQMEF
jgi:hypothetical protein